MCASSTCIPANFLSNSINHSRTLLARRSSPHPHFTRRRRGRVGRRARAPTAAPPTNRLMSFFSRLTDLAAAAARSVSETVVSAAAAMNLDALQDEGAARREAYAGLDITYLTPRVAVMTFPAYPNSRVRSRNDAGTVAALLAERHGAQAMLWNLSEESYDGALWGGCV